MIIKESEERLYAKAINHWGPYNQLYMVIEEASELIKALCKANRRGLPALKDDIAEEMADMEIMLGQLHVLMRMEDPEFEQGFAIIKAKKFARLRGIVEETEKLEAWNNEQ